jgi:DNA-binding transcriptional MerR regulator
MDTAGPLTNLPQALPLAGERVAFTGTLASMTHREAHAQVEKHGGIAAEHISRQTTMLVVGEEGWPLEADGQPSVKLRHIERLNAEGREIRIVRESEWLEFIGLESHRHELHRRCTPAMLSKMLDVSVHEIRRWERQGLIHAVSHVCRLPYFDFQEVAGVRRLAALVGSGVSVREIQTSLARLESVLGVGSRPLTQLEILAADKHLGYRDAAGRLKTTKGQRLFDFDGPASTEAPTSEMLLMPVPVAENPARSDWNAADWYEEGRRLADEGLLERAVESLRMSLMGDSDAPEVQFHLAEVLYRQGNTLGALERYHVAAELDHNYLEAWTQIGCLLAELDRLGEAIDAFRIAIDIHPDYPDAHLHLAEALHQTGRTSEAVGYWQKYLEFDKTGPWAEAARRRLDEVSGTGGAPNGDLPPA